MKNIIKLNEDNYPLYLVKMNFVQFGVVYVEVAAESVDEAIENAYLTMTSLKRNDCDIESVSALLV